MNNKITFPKLASLLAEKSGRSKRFSEDFLRELFALISEQLEAGESVKIKGLGTFRLLKVEPRKSVDVTSGQPIEISGHNKITFTPAKELAEEINSPFEAFSAIEIADDVDLDQIMDEATDNSEMVSKGDQEEILLMVSECQERAVEPVFSEPAASISSEPIADISTEQVSDASTEPVADSTPGAAADVPSEPFTDISSDPVADVSLVPSSEEEPTETRLSNIIRTRPVVDNDEIIYVDETPAVASRRQRGYSDYGNTRDQGSSWLKILLVGVVCALFAIVLTFLIWSILTKPDFSNVSHEYTDDATEYANELMMNSDVDISLETQPETEADKSDDATNAVDADAVATQPSDALVYDTIGKARFLTTMAKDHYGDNKFWPYIYEANKDHIGHPDRIRPGTAIIIPKLSTFGVEPSNPDDVEKAKRLGVEIYARYGKSL